MFNGLDPCFIAKYAGSYEILHKSHLDVYTLKLPTNFVGHLTFHVLKLKLFLCDDHKLNQKQKVQLDVNAIEHKQKPTPCEANMPQRQGIFDQVQGLLS
jgi:hypothetical protein